MPRTPSTHRSTLSVHDRLLKIAYDVSWSWHELLQRPFAMLNPTGWEYTNHSPIETIQHTHSERMADAAQDKKFIQVLENAERHLNDIRNHDRWFKTKIKGNDQQLRVAYYCSEFAIHESMQQYSGGLGVLAGDHLKSAEDLGVPITGVGLLYRHGYYRQQFTSEGRTKVVYPTYDFDTYPIEDTHTYIECPIGNRTVHARIWKLMLGATPLYLLDTDLKENRPQDRLLTEGLYKGEPDLRMKQQVLLGVGGAMALEKLNAGITVHHLNEGHAAFAGLERIARHVEHGSTLEEAIQHVRSTTAFTTHTPVPAGHDRYDAQAATNVMRSVLRRCGIAPRDFANLGRVHPGDTSEQICMTVLALRLSEFVNGVAQLHGEVTREMWQDVYDVSSVDDVPVGAITNGVHPGTWIDPAASRFWKKNIGLKIERARPTESAWKKATDVDPQAAWDLRNSLRGRMVEFIRRRNVLQAMGEGARPDELLEAGKVLSKDALTIGFARRFATYKRSPLIFNDPKRLASILNNSDRPVQIVFAGKAHPRDQGGQDFARTIHRMSRTSEFRGKVILLEEYDMRIGRELTSGCDIWLNNPIRPHEASGTSGMKPPMHLGLNCSILDGWWPEGYDGQNGWVIEGTPKKSGDRARDRADAESMYDVLEHSILPEFYTRDRNGLPKKWIKRSLHAASTIPAQFSTHRMVWEYLEHSYRMAHQNA